MVIDLWLDRLYIEVEHFSRILSQVHDCLIKVKRVVEQKELDRCFSEGHEERLKSIHDDLRDLLLIDTKA